jgi:antitoxin component YwqK of YwqJK toxin-antitoxin module
MLEHENKNLYQQIQVFLLGNNLKKTFTYNGAGNFVITGVKNGIYNIEIESNTKSTALYSYLLKKMKISNSDTMIEKKIFLLKLSGCVDYVLDGSLSQKDTLFHKSGGIYAFGKYRMAKKDGKKIKIKNGVWKYFYESGQLKTEITYLDGKPNFIKTFFDNGLIKYSGQFLNGCKVGLWNYYPESAEIVKLTYTPYRALISMSIEYTDNLFRNYKSILLEE